MSETTVWQDAEGNYYAFAADDLAAAQAADGSYELAAEAVDAARVPDEGRGALEAALGQDEVSGFALGQPIPGVDIIIRKNPGGSAMFSSLGSLAAYPQSGFATGGSSGVK